MVVSVGDLVGKGYDSLKVSDSSNRNLVPYHFAGDTASVRSKPVGLLYVSAFSLSLQRVLSAWY